MSIYLQLPHAKGNVKIQGYEGWVELEDIELASITTPATMEIGTKMDPYGHKPYFGQVILVKRMDPTSNIFFEAAHNRKRFDKVTVAYVSSGHPVTTYAKTELSNVIVTHYSERHSGEWPLDLISLAYDKIERSYIPHNDDNKPGNQHVTGYDLERATRL